MSDIQKLIQGETTEWQDVIQSVYEELKAENPNITADEAVSVAIIMRSLCHALLDNLGQKETPERSGAHHKINENL
jgi:hypothetical protein